MRAQAMVATFPIFAEARSRTNPEPKLQKLYDALEISASPVGTQKTIN